VGVSSSNISTHSRIRTHNVECDTDAQEETLYTCPSNCRSHVSLVFVVNTGGNVTVDVEFNRAPATQTTLGVDSHMHILGGKNMSAEEYIQFTGAEMVMEPGDTITVTATGTTPHVDVMCTVEEFFLLPG
jgi:hypothetical protein